MSLLQFIQLAVPIGTLAVAIFVAWRTGGWRSSDAQEARESRTGQRIERIDATARATIERLEKDLRGELGGMNNRLTRLEERVEHLPTAQDVKELADRVGEIEVQVAGVAEKVSNTQEMVRVVRDHILESEKR